MSKEEAFHALGSVAPLRPAIRAEVYRYWKDKRRRLGRPLVRRLQAPTSANDPNHYHVFRWAALRGLQVQGSDHTHCVALQALQICFATTSSDESPGVRQTVQGRDARSDASRQPGHNKIASRPHQV